MQKETWKCDMLAIASLEEVAGTLNTFIWSVDEYLYPSYKVSTHFVPLCSLAMINVFYLGTGFRFVSSSLDNISSCQNVAEILEGQGMSEVSIINNAEKLVNIIHSPAEQQSPSVAPPNNLVSTMQELCQRLATDTLPIPVDGSAASVWHAARQISHWSSVFVSMFHHGTSTSTSFPVVPNTSMSVPAVPHTSMSVPVVPHMSTSVPVVPHTSVCPCCTPHIYVCPSCAWSIHVCPCCTPHVHICPCCSPHHVCPCRTPHIHVCPCCSPHIYVCPCCSPHVHICPCCSPHVYVCPCCSPHIYVSPCCTPHICVCTSCAWPIHVCPCCSQHIHVCPCCSPHTCTPPIDIYICHVMSVWPSHRCSVGQVCQKWIVLCSLAGHPVHSTTSELPARCQECMGDWVQQLPASVWMDTDDANTHSRGQPALLLLQPAKKAIHVFQSQQLWYWKSRGHLQGKQTRETL